MVLFHVKAQSWSVFLSVTWGYSASVTSQYAKDINTRVWVIFHKIELLWWFFTCQVPAHSFAKFVAKVFDKLQPCADTKSYTPAKNHTSVRHVARHSTDPLHWTPTWGYIRGSGHTFVSSVEKVLADTGKKLFAIIHHEILSFSIAGFHQKGNYKNHKLTHSGKTSFNCLWNKTQKQLQKNEKLPNGILQPVQVDAMTHTNAIAQCSLMTTTFLAEICANRITFCSRNRECDWRPATIH